MNIAKFIKSDGTFVNGAFEINDRNKVTIRIESEDKHDLDEFIHSNLINCISNSQKYFFFQNVYRNKGYITVKEITTFFLELDSYAFGKGDNCTDLESLQIEELGLSFNYFDDWYLGLRLQVLSDEEHLKNIEKRMLGAVHCDTFQVNDITEINFITSGSQLYEFKENHYVSIKNSTKKFSEYWKNIVKLSSFLSIMCFRPVEIVNEVFCVLPETKTITFNFYKWIEEEKLDKQFNLSYLELNSDFNKIIKNYFNDSKIESALSTLTSSLYINESNIGGGISKYLNITRVIESLYENVLYDFTTKEQEYRSKIVQIIEKLDEKQDRKFMYDKLNLAHKATFVMKITQFFKDCKNILDIDDQTCELLAKILRQTRNYYTHLLTSRKLVIKENYLGVINRALLGLVQYRLVMYLNNNNNLRNARFGYLKISTQQFKQILHDDINEMLEEI